MEYLDATNMGASKEGLFRRLRTGEAIHIPTFEQFITLLSECRDIDLASFDQHARKPLATFYEETQREALVCREAYTGLAVRLARSVKIQIINPETGVRWLEVGRGSANSEPLMKERDYTLSETLLFGESVFSGAVRCIANEAHLIAKEVELRSSHGLAFEDRHISSAYPNVVSIVQNFYVTWPTTKLCDAMGGRAHLFTDDGVYILVRPFPGSPDQAQDCAPPLVFIP